MNKEIEYIINITTSATLDATGQWTYTGGLPNGADECCIRQVTYNSSNAAHPVYNVRSDLTNGIIASVASIIGFISNPDTRIQLRTFSANQLMFQVQTATGASTTGASGDFIAINMDFIKYRR